MNAVGYVRYASAAIEDKQRVANDPQGTVIKTYCNANNIELLEIFYDIGVSGSDFERSGWKDMEEYISGRKGEVAYLIVKDYHRIGRNVIAVAQKVTILELDFGIKILPLLTNFLPDLPSIKQVN